MNKLVFHIGFHKSASTFLQRKVFPFLNLNYIFLNRNLLNQIENADFNIEKFKSETKFLLDKANHQLTLISHEELSGHPEGTNNKTPFIVADNIKKLDSNTKIIIIIRNQLSYLNSYYTYRVSMKGHEFRTLSKFLDIKGESGLFEKLKYSHLISYYYSTFGKNNILVIPMELIKKDYDYFINEVTDFIGVKKVNIKIEDAQNVSAKTQIILNFWKPFNFLFSGLLKVLVFILRPNKKYPFVKFRFAYYRLKRSITKMLNKRFKHSKKIDIKSYRNYNQLYNKYSSDNIKTQQLIKYDLKEFSYPL